jgi:succinate dehydrogenase hydrophobic anchor subunit
MPMPATKSPSTARASRVSTCRCWNAEMPAWSVILLLLAMLGFVAWGAWGLWHQLEGVAIEMHGQIALALGAGMALLLTVMFMVLIYISRSRGFDERAHDADRPDDDSR